MPPPYTDERIAVLRRAVRNSKPASSDWPSYAIKIVGSATCYNDAVKKLKGSKTKSYAFTSDDEESVTEKETAAMQRYMITEEACEEDWHVSPLPLLADTGDVAISAGVPVLESPLLPPLDVSGERGGEPTVINESLFNIITGGLEYDKMIRDIAGTVKESVIGLAASIESIQESQSLLSYQMNELFKEVRSLKTDVMCFKTTDPRSAITFLEHGFELPLKTLSDFTEFEKTIAIDAKRAENIKTLIWHQIDVSRKPLESIRQIIKTFVTKEIVSGFTAVKVSGAKKIFTETKFFRSSMRPSSQNTKNTALTFFQNKFPKPLRQCLTPQKTGTNAAGRRRASNRRNIVTFSKKLCL